MAVACGNCRASLVDVPGACPVCGHRAPDGDYPVRKLLNSDDLNRVVVDETLKLSTDAYFRRAYAAMEVKNDRINDPWEGIRLYEQERPIVGIAGLTDAERSAVRLAVGAEIADDFTGTIAGNRIWMVAEPFHMLCVTRATPKEAFAEFNKPAYASIRPYDRCITFGSLFTLCELLIEGTVRLPTGDKPFIECFDGVKVSKVSYEPVRTGWTATTLQGSPAMKDPSFADQQETRLIPVRRKNVSLPDTIIIHVPSLKDAVADIAEA